MTSAAKNVTNSAAQGTPPQHAAAQEAAKLAVKAAKASAPAVAFVLFILLAVLGIFGGGFDDGDPYAGFQPSGAGEELNDVLDERFDLYVEAAADAGIPWTVLAGAAEILTDHGRFSPYDHIDRDPERADLVDDDGNTGSLYRRAATGTALDVTVGGAPSDARSVTIVGDRWVTAAVPALSQTFSSAGWTVTDADAVGADLGAVATHIEERSATLGPVVIVDARASDGADADAITADLNRIAVAAGLPRSVYFVNDAAGTPAAEAFNQALTEYASRAPNVHVISWAARATSPTFDGTDHQARGQMIAETVVGYQGSTGNVAANPPGTSAAAQVTGTGTSFETVSPPIGAGSGDALGPFLIDPTQIQGRDRPSISEFSDYPTMVELFASLVADAVTSSALPEPDGDDLDAADAYWIQILASLPVVDPTNPALSCTTSADDTIVTLIQVIWRCEARAYDDLAVVTGLTSGPDGELTPEVVTGAGAVIQLLDDAYQAAWAWSQWGTDPNGPDAGEACDPSAPLAGVFPLTASQFDAARSDDDAARNADRCDPIANIRAAARIVLAGESGPVQGRAGEGTWAHTWGGWAQIAHVTGPESARQEFLAGGPAAATASNECVADAQRYVTDAGRIAELTTFTDRLSPPPNATLRAAHLQILALGEDDPRTGSCSNLTPDAWVELISSVGARLAEEVDSDATAEDPDGTRRAGTDDEASEPVSADAIRGFVNWAHVFNLPGAGETRSTCRVCDLPQARTVADPSSRARAQQAVGTTALISRFSSGPLGWVVPAADVRISIEDKEALAARVVDAAIYYGGIVPDDPRAGTRPLEEAAGGDVVAGLVAAGVPEAAARAYVAAVEFHLSEFPDSGMTVAYLAAFAHVESAHGTFGGAVMDSAGNISPPIIGIPLNGTNGTARILDTDGGRYDNDTTYDRAVGPFQFIPTTWEAHARDVNGDGVIDPQNMHDAAAAAATYLYRSAAPLDTLALKKDAAFAYNRSTEYVNAVIDQMLHYESVIAATGFTGAEIDMAGARPAKTATGDIQIIDVRGITVNVTVAAQVEAMLAHAERDGLVLTGSGFRSFEGQIAVRKSNCGTSEFAIWEMRAGQCSPPTARPGTSMHEQGLAIDFANCSTRSTACHQWLAQNAATYGFKNLPSEPWHWSTTGG